MRIKLLVFVVVIFVGIVVFVDEDVNLFVNGEIEMIVCVLVFDYVDGLYEVLLGWVFCFDEMQVLQMDDFENFGMIFVDEVCEIWVIVEGLNGESCVFCYGEFEEMVGVCVVYLKWNENVEEVCIFVMQINVCCEEQMGVEFYGYIFGSMVNMEVLFVFVSCGMFVNVVIDGFVVEIYVLGEEFYYVWIGQLELSCVSCYEQNYGNYICVDYLLQGQINGFLIYCLKNVKLNIVYVCFKGCVCDICVEIYSLGSLEFIVFEFYVVLCGNGLSVEGFLVCN